MQSPHLLTSQYRGMFLVGSNTRRLLGWHVFLSKLSASFRFFLHVFRYVLCAAFLSFGVGTLGASSVWHVHLKVLPPPTSQSFSCVQSCFMARESGWRWSEKDRTPSSVQAVPDAWNLRALRFQLPSSTVMLSPLYTSLGTFDFIWGIVKNSVCGLIPNFFDAAVNIVSALMRKENLLERLPGLARHLSYPNIPAQSRGSAPCSDQAFVRHRRSSSERNVQGEVSWPVANWLW